MPLQPPIAPEVQALIQSLLGPPQPQPPQGPLPPAGPAQPFDPGFHPLDALGGFLLDLFGQAQQAPEATAPQPESAMFAPPPTAQLDLAGTPQQAAIPAPLLLGAASALAARHPELISKVFPSDIGVGFQTPQGGLLEFATNPANDVLDLFNVKATSPQEAKQLFQLADSLGQEAGTAVRRGEFLATPAGEASVAKALAKGNVVETPLGKLTAATADLVDEGGKALSRGGPGFSARLPAASTSIEDIVQMVEAANVDKAQKEVFKLLDQALKKGGRSAFKRQLTKLSKVLPINDLGKITSKGGRIIDRGLAQAGGLRSVIGRGAPSLMLGPDETVQLLEALGIDPGFGLGIPTEPPADPRFDIFNLLQKAASGLPDPLSGL